MDKAIIVADASNEAIGWENPYGTAQGQIQIGMSEGLFQYLSRNGLLQQQSAYDVAVPQGSLTQILAMPSCPQNYKQYLLKAVISATGPGKAVISYRQDLASTSTPFYQVAYIDAYTPWETDTLGAVWTNSTNTIAVSFQAQGSGVVAAATVYWVEV